MSSAETGPARKKLSSVRKMIEGTVILLTSIVLLWCFPGTRLAMFLAFAPTRRIAVPALSSPDAITPGTVRSVRLREHWGNGTFGSIAWSPDGRLLAILTTFGVNLYDVKTFELLRMIYIPVSQPGLPSFSPDGSRLAFTNDQGVVAIFDLQENELLQRWDTVSHISLLTFLRDGTLIYVTQAGEVRRLVDGAWQTVTTLKDGYLTGVAFLPEQQALAAVYDKSTWLVDPHTGQSRKLSFVAPYGGDLLVYRNNRVEVNRDLYLVSSYMEDTLVNQVVLPPMELFQLLALSPQGDWMATLNTEASDPWGGELTLWNLPGLERIRSITVPEVNLEGRNEIAFSPDGEQIAVLASPHLVKIYPLQENSSGSTIADPLAGIGDYGISPGGSIWMVNCTGRSVQIVDQSSGAVIDEWVSNGSSCGQLLQDGVSVAISEPYEKTRIYKIGGPLKPVTVNAPCCKVFSADGSVGAGGSERQSSGDPFVIRIWQQKFGPYQNWAYRQEEFRGVRVAVSPSGQYAAASSRQRTHLYVRGIEVASLYPTLQGKFTFSPDERSLASAFEILDLKTAKMIELEGSSSLSCSPETFSNPAFTPDGQLVAVSACGQLIFWRVNDGARLAELADPYASYELQFSPDGTFLLGEGDGNASVWVISNAVP